MVSCEGASGKRPPHKWLILAAPAALAALVAGVVSEGNGVNKPVPTATSGRCFHRLNNFAATAPFVAAAS